MGWSRRCAGCGGRKQKRAEFVVTLAGTGFAAAARLGLAVDGCSAVAAAGGVLVCSACTYILELDVSGDGDDEE